MKKNIKGFTLTELIVVIAIIAILAAVLIPTSVVFIGKAKESSDMQEAMGTHKSYLAQVAPDLDKADYVYGCSYKLGGFYLWKNDVLEDEKVNELPELTTQMPGVDKYAVVVLSSNREYLGYVLYTWNSTQYEVDSSNASYTDGFTSSGVAAPKYIKLQ